MSSAGTTNQNNALKANRNESSLIYAGPLAVGDYSSEMGPFKARIKSLRLTPAMLEFEITGSDGAAGDFEVSGVAISKADGKCRCSKAVGFRRSLTQHTGLIIAISCWRDIHRWDSANSGRQVKPWVVKFDSTQRLPKPLNANTTKGIDEQPGEAAQ